MRMGLLLLCSPVVWYHTLQNVIPDNEHKETEAESVLMIFPCIPWFLKIVQQRNFGSIHFLAGRQCTQAAILTHVQGLTCKSVSPICADECAALGREDDAGLLLFIEPGV